MSIATQQMKQGHLPSGLHGAAWLDGDGNIKPAEGGTGTATMTVPSIISSEFGTVTYPDNMAANGNPMDRTAIAWRIII